MMPMAILRDIIRKFKQNTGVLQLQSCYLYYLYLQ